MAPAMTTRPLSVIFLIDARAGSAGDDLAVADVDIADFAVDPLGRVVDFSAGELDQHRLWFRALEGSFDGGEHVGDAREAWRDAGSRKGQRHDVVAAHETSGVVEARRADGNEDGRVAS